MVKVDSNNQISPLQLDWLVANLRWLWLFLVAMFILVSNFIVGVPPPKLANLVILTVLAFGLNGIYVALLWGKFFPTWLAAMATVIDLGFTLALISLAEPSQFLMALVLYPVVVTSIRWNTEAGLIMALAITIFFAAPLVTILQSSPIDRAELIAALTTLGGNGLILILAGTLPGFFVRQRVDFTQKQTEAELQRLRVENERGRLISDMARTLSATLNYRNVLRATIETAFRAMAEVGKRDESMLGMVLLFEGDDDLLTVASGRNISRNDEGRKVRADEGIIGRTVSSAEVTITNRAAQDKSLSTFASTPGCKSAICAPLRAGFHTYGMILFCSTEPNVYTEEHINLLSAFCSQAIISLQNAQLFEDIHREQQRILEKEAEARRKLARDLHDGPTQSIAAIVMRLNFIKMVLENGDVDKALEEVIKVEDIAQRTTHEIRTMLFAMRPVILETQGLIPALNQYADRLNQNESFQVSIVNRGYEGQLEPDAEGVVFAIIEEAISNAKKHAQASEIRVGLGAGDDALFVEIRDNGVGFDVERTQSTYDQRTSLGLINMNERAEIVGGECTLESARGRGTTVKVKIPYRQTIE